MNVGTDYMDGDVAYLLGLAVARGELAKRGIGWRLIVRFPKGALLAEGESLRFDTDKEIRLGITKTRERLLDLLGADIRTVESKESWDLVVHSTRSTVAWRNLISLLRGKKSFPYFAVPDALFDPQVPLDVKREFIRGYADVAGNIRPSNADWAGRHRVRLDTLNYPTNWQLPVQLCLLLQDHLDVPVPNIIWGHPNLNREWREHQLNIYAEDFQQIGFFFDYKQEALIELAASNLNRFDTRIRGCPGVRPKGPKKSKSPAENSDRLDSRLRGKHCDAYWQICKVLGCPRTPAPDEQIELIPEE